MEFPDGWYIVRARKTGGLPSPERPRESEMKKANPARSTNKIHIRLF